MTSSDWRHVWSRRRLIGWGCGVSGAAAVFRGGKSAASELDQIPQPLEPTEQAFIERAFAMRDLALSAGDQGYGALIVNASSLEIVGQSPSRVVTDGDPTGHAEMAAIRDAARRLRTRELSHHVMYSSSRPCPMCEAAAFWAGLDGLYFGQSGQHAGRPALCRGT